MDFTYPAEAEAFRAEFRAWLDENYTDEFRAEGLGFSMEMDAERLAAMRGWNRKLAEARFAAISTRPSSG